MTTQCTTARMQFQPLGRREVIGTFDGGTLTSDGGGLLLAEVEQRTGLLRQFAACFTDHRDPDLLEHSVLDLVRQRVYGLALGYEDLNDHDELRRDPLLATLVGKADPTGQDRARRRDVGRALAGKSTLNRLELTPAEATAASRYQKVVVDGAAVDRLFVDTLLAAQATPPARLVLDLDVTDDPLHGHQEGRFFHGYYREYCYLPLYIFAGDHLLCARLRTADQDAAAGVVEEVTRIVGQLRAAWPTVAITVRGDAGFCRDELMTWCEANGVDYVLGLAKNSRLVEAIAAEMAQARQQYELTGAAARVFADLRYQTRESWRRERRVIGKAEHLAKGANPRFVVTSLPPEQRAARPLYEEDYCGRGEMENRIKEQQLYLFADRTSTATLRANQLRLWFSAVAYLLVSALRRVGLRGTALASAQCHTIRLKLLKLGAQLTVSVRRIWVAFSSACPVQALWAQVLANLRSWTPAMPVPLRC